jgi:hypothetical protein
MTDDFNKWWNDNVFTKNNPYTNDTPAFWAWEGWHAAIAAEREACAKVCDEKFAAEYATGKVDHNEIGWTQACAIAIRARGDALAKLNQAAEANGEEL